MTTFDPHPDTQLDLIRRAMRYTADAWEDGFSAAKDHDVRAARRVMRGAATRRSMLRTTHQQLQWSGSTPGLAAVRRASPADVVADLMHINRLLGQLSQTILAAPDAGLLADRERADLDAARRIGSERLWCFAESMPRPMLDRDYIVAGHDLLDALADLAEIAPRRNTTPDVCLALMIALVETSRHVTHIA